MLITVSLSTLRRALQSDPQRHVPSKQQLLLSFPSLLTSMYFALAKCE